MLVLALPARRCFTAQLNNTEGVIQSIGHIERSALRIDSQRIGRAANVAVSPIKQSHKNRIGDLLCRTSMNRNIIAVAIGYVQKLLIGAADNGIRDAGQRTSSRSALPCVLSIMDTVPRAIAPVFGSM